MVKSVLFTKQKEKSKEKDGDKELLSKKRPEPDTPPQKDIDMVKLKKKINDIMDLICSPNNSGNNNGDYLYKSMNKKYLLNEFTSNCLNYINKIIIDVKKNHLKKFQGIFELNKIFISIIKELLMNEFELLLLSLYLESIDISLNSDLFTFQESLIYLCYFIKKLTLSPEKLSPINSFLIRKYQGFDDKFNKWFQSNSSVFNNKLYFSYTEINQRFKEFNNSYSVYCKNNYIDYNLIIDRILTMSIPYNESKNENIFVDKKVNSTDLLFESNNTGSLKNINENKNNNINEIFFTTTNSNNYNKNNCNNNINKINNLYAPNFISTFPTGIFINTNNNPDINLGYLYNGNNIIYNQINKNINNEQISPQIINKEFIKIKPSDPKIKTTFKVNNINNSNNLNISKNFNSIEDTQKSNTFNNKPLFITEEDKKKEDNIIGDETKMNRYNVNNSNLNKNQLNLEKKNNKEVSLTPNNLLYSLDDENINNINQNNNIDNYNLVEKMYKQINNDKNNNNIVNNNLIKNNEGININQNPNNIIGFNTSQHIQDFNALKYNGNLGVSDYITPSFLSSKNPYFADLNNLYQNSFHQIDQDENMKQLYQSNENFFRSYFSMNSSKNFYPVINNNYTNSIGESGNINNINYAPNNQMMGNNNNAFLKLNNGFNTQNYGKNNIIPERKSEEKDKNNGSN